MNWRSSFVGYFADMAATPVILIAVAAYFGCPSLLAVLLGFAAWQPFEWATHRYLLHGPVRHQHRLHHREPTGDAGVPVAITVSLQLLLLGALILLAGGDLGGSLFVGFGLGYWTYNLTHWAIHAGYWPATGPLAGVARRHLLHHDGAPANFNVLFPICDLCAGTFRKA